MIIGAPLVRSTRISGVLLGIFIYFFYLFWGNVFPREIVRRSGFLRGPRPIFPGDIELSVSGVVRKIFHLYRGFIIIRKDFTSFLLETESQSRTRILGELDRSLDFSHKLGFVTIQASGWMSVELNNRQLRPNLLCLVRKFQLENLLKSGLKSVLF